MQKDKMQKLKLKLKFTSEIIIIKKTISGRGRGCP
jgi:hypothetical protein